MDAQLRKQKLISPCLIAKNDTCVIGQCREVLYADPFKALNY